MSKELLKKVLLLPLSGLYGFGVGARGMMFKTKIFKRRKFDIPVIVVGNIAVGGTGKTPHSEYIIALLKKKYVVGVISRGYGRKTSGFIAADSKSTPETIGDEPYQMYRKFADDRTFFAVCEDRCVGIDTLRELHPEIDVIVLDDAYQHRYVNPDISIVLTEFGRPAFNDTLLPYGRLREPMSAMKEADIVVVTKCPDNIRPIDYRIFKNKLELFPFQKLFFSSFRYRQPVPVFPNRTSMSFDLRSLGENDTILAVAGIGNPRPFLKYLRGFRFKVGVRLFNDHHNFGENDINAIIDKFNSMPGKRKVIITTEKDAVRMFNNEHIPEEMKKVLFYLPIEVVFDDEYSKDETFNSLLLSMTAQIKSTKTLQKPKLQG